MSGAQPEGGIDVVGGGGEAVVTGATLGNDVVVLVGRTVCVVGAVDVGGVVLVVVVLVVVVLGGTQSGSGQSKVIGCAP